MTSVELAGRVALVTGASGGIGRVTALTLARAGADVGLLGRDEAGMARVADEVVALGRRAAVARMDLRDADSVAPAVRELEAGLGPVDLLVCNSGLSGPATPVWDYPVEEFEAVLDVNVRGAFLCCRAVLPGMVERGAGAVVVVGSVAGKRPTAGRSAYCAAKAGLVGLVRTMALEAGPHGIRVNMVVPGGVAGERLDETIREVVEATGADPEEVRASYSQGAPLRRLVQPEDVAEAVAYLLSDRAANITGEDLNVTAGLVMH